jgi:hypothetical protein
MSTPPATAILDAIRRSESIPHTVKPTKRRIKVVRLESKSGNRLFEVDFRKGTKFYVIGEVEGLENGEVLIWADGKYFAAPKNML